MTPLNRPSRRQYVTNRSVENPWAGSGFSLIEVLVALVITALGLLGLAALQSKLQVSGIESYQRAQALLLVQDMGDRIATNRKHAADYMTNSGTLGTGDTTAADCSTLSTIALQDRCEWSKTLQGEAEKSGTAQRGAMTGARGCIQDLGNASYLVSVVWQGLIPLAAPAGVTCGAGLYGTSGTPCADDKCRRAVSTIVRIGTLR
jgi:type IV pilus assembly protein PilV